MPRSIRTEISIDAPAGHVWDTLMDFGTFERWAPFFASIEGTPEVGRRLTVKFRNGMTVKPVVTEAEPGRVLEWRGKVGFKGLFDAVHRFEITPEGEATRFIHTEQFSGLLVPLFGRVIRKTAREFEVFNDALKQRCEGEEGTMAVIE
jgi:hypothetical protein